MGKKREVLSLSRKNAVLSVGLSALTYFFIVFLAAFFALSLVILVMIGITTNVSASFEIGNTSHIETNYAPEAVLQGYINISLDEEDSDSIITAGSRFSGSISLERFLDANSASYSCMPSDCEDDYETSNPETTKTFSLSSEEEKIIAFVLEGEVEGATGLSFQVNADNENSCLNPLEIDVFNDDEIEWISSSVDENYSCTYETGRGCFNASSNITEVFMGGNTRYCEKIKLLKNKNFSLGAWVKKTDGALGWTNGLLKMQLYDTDDTLETSCNLPQPSTDGGEVSCIAGYENDEIQDYYVCIKAVTHSSQANTGYKIKRENTRPCGFYDTLTAYNYDYYIFAKSPKFKTIANAKINQTSYNIDVDEYIQDRYDENCTDGCRIPVRFKAKTRLNISVSNLALDYIEGGSPQKETNIYDATIEPAKISSGFRKLNLRYSNITVPEDEGNYTLRLYLDGDELLEDSVRISVQESPLKILGLSPRILPAGSLTKFTADVSSRNLTLAYTWDFGDNTTEETSVNYASHAYSQIRTYTLTLEVEGGGITASKTFDIEAVNPKDSANTTIRNYRKRINNLSLQTGRFEQWYQEIIKNATDLNALNSTLNYIERQYSLTTTNEGYIRVMGNLSAMRVPYKLDRSIAGKTILLVAPQEIDVELLSELGAGDFEDEESYQTSVARWLQDNLIFDLNFSFVSAYYDDSIENIAGVFNLMLAGQGSNEELFLIIESENIVYDRNYTTRKFPGAAGIVLPSRTTSIKFAVPDVILDDLLVYASPGFDKLEVETIGEYEPETRWKLAGILLGILFLIAIISYMLMQWWYKRKYESYLFKNRKDIYNIMNFISNARSQGLPDSEIMAKLKKAGWKGEQINYVFKKMKGKAIMPFDFLKMFQKEGLGGK